VSILPISVQGLNYSERGARSLNLKKKLESQNEFTLVGEYKYERQRVCEHRHIFTKQETVVADKPRDAFVHAMAWMTS